MNLDLDPGAAIHLYHELVAPYQELTHGKVPPLVEMHLRDLARLQLELNAWEAIRDAEMQHRAEQADLDEQKIRFAQDRELSATSSNVFAKGLCSEPDSSGKFRNQSECLLLLRDCLRAREFDRLESVLARLYGEDLVPGHDRGLMICGFWRDLTKDEGAEALDDDDDFKQLLKLVEDEYRDVMRAWELELRSQRLTEAAKRGRLAPTREDHWMNRQGDRLRQAIDRKMKFTVTLLKALGLGQEAKPRTASKKRRKTRKMHKKIRRGLQSRAGSEG